MGTHPSRLRGIDKRHGCRTIETVPRRLTPRDDSTVRASDPTDRCCIAYGLAIRNSTAYFASGKQLRGTQAHALGVKSSLEH